MRPDLSFVISDFGGGGAQRVLATLIPVWLAAGARIEVVTLDADVPDAYPLPTEVRRVALRSPWKGRGAARNLGLIVALRRHLRRSRPRMALGFIAPTAVLLALASWNLPGRYVLCERNDPDQQRFGRVWDVLRDRVYRRARVVTANSLGVVERLRDHGCNAMYLPNPVRQAVSNAVDLPLRTLLAVGRLHHQKGYDRLISALARTTGWYLEILGTGAQLEELAGLAESAGVSDRIRWHGHRDPGPWYASDAVFIMSSRHEGSPNALLEAMAAGMPVIVPGDVPGVTELVRDGIDGVHYDPEDPCTLEAALSSMEDWALRRRLGGSARHRVAARGASTVAHMWMSVLVEDAKRS